MKKLMIAAAAAALAGGSFALDAQVYEMTLTAKTTTCDAAKASGAYLLNVLGYEKGDQILYRKQTSRKLVVVIWGCSCDQVFGQDGAWGEVEDGQTRVNKYTGEEAKPWYGSVIFDKKNGVLLDTAADESTPWENCGITFTVLNRIGKKANEIEMAWELDLGAESPVVGAGFGKIKDNFNEENDCIDEDSVVSSAKGTFAGFIPAQSLYVIYNENDCPYCTEVEDEELECAPWAYCECIDATDEDNTILFGNWSLKYNSSAAKKLSKSSYIVDSYKFPKAVSAALAVAGE